MDKESAVGGRPELDLALVLRNWGWYLLVKGESGLSDKAIDHHLLKISPTKNVDTKSRFGDMRNDGCSPNERIRGGSKQTVYDLVHQNAKYATAGIWFNSEIWDLLSDSTLAPSDYERCARKLLRYDQGSENYSLFTRLKDDLVGSFGFMHQPGNAPNGHQSTPGFAGTTGIDRMALLCATYRFSLHSRDEVFVAYAHYWLLETIRSFVKEPPLSYDFVGCALGQCFELLILDRIVDNRWVRKCDIAAAFGQAEKQKTNKNYAARYIAYRSPLIKLSWQATKPYAGVTFLNRQN